jgi:nitrate/nitrite transport system substrate-binding protein
MGLFDNPFDSGSRLRCSCGRHTDNQAHEAAIAGEEALAREAIEGAVMRALFPRDAERRRFLRAVGANAALGAIASIFPLGALEAMAQDKGKVEKKDVKIGFIPITCATPLIMSAPLGFYEKQGLNVTLVKTAGWALIRDKVMNKEYDASHLLAPMPLAISLGVGSGDAADECRHDPELQRPGDHAGDEAQGQSRPEELEGLQVRGALRVLDAQFPAALLPRGERPRSRQGCADPRGATARDGGQPARRQPRWLPRSRSLQPARGLRPGRFHPSADQGALGRPSVLLLRNARRMGQGESQHFRRALPRGAQRRRHGRGPQNRTTIAEAIAPANYLNQPVAVLEQVLTGKYADGLGNVKTVPNRIEFEPVPWNALGVWILSQMKRWGYLKGDVRYKDIVDQVYLMTDAKKRMKEEGIIAPAEGRKIVVMGKVFDPAKADAYVASFAIKKTA